MNWDKHTTGRRPKNRGATRFFSAKVSSLHTLREMAEEMSEESREEALMEIHRLTKWLSHNKQRSRCWKRRQINRVAGWFKQMKDAPV